MKKILLLVVATFVLISCEQKTKEIYKNYPKDVTKVLENHGGLDHWKKIQVVSFQKGKETHTFDLHSKKTAITSPTYSLGFDGKKVWVSDTAVYKGNPKHYHNLYSHLFAMPFLLTDENVTFKETKPLQFQGKTYQGYIISDNEKPSGTNYVMYYNTDTYKMKWLAYTSKNNMEAANLVRYNDWQNVNGFNLPKTITWYKKDTNGNPTSPLEKVVEFTLPLVSQGKLADRHYQKPATE